MSRPAQPLKGICHLAATGIVIQTNNDFRQRGNFIGFHSFSFIWPSGMSRQTKQNKQKKEYLALAEQANTGGVVWRILLFSRFEHQVYT
jgi:hypothetical protein